MFASSIFIILVAFAHIVDPLEIAQRIIKGHKAKLGQFPWQVILKKVGSEDSACGASLISKDWVLTAAHCVNRETKLVLMFGSVHLVNHTAPNMTSDKLHYHPGYKTGDIENDIAVIELPKSVKLNNYIKTIALPPKSKQKDTFVKKKGKTAGFGLNDDTTYKFPNDLWYTKVQVINQTACSAGLKQTIPNGTICVEGTEEHHHASTCNGDSGSALVIKDDNGKYMQIGVTSFVAEGLCQKGYPAGFARVTEYLEWIHNMTGIALK